MSTPLAEAWNEMDNDARWRLLNATDIQGLRKCSIACQPFERINRKDQDKLVAAHAKQQ